MKFIKYTLAFVVLFTTNALFSQIKDSKIKTLIVFFDGLRPDYITPELMPNVYEFKKMAVMASNTIVCIRQ